MKQQTCRYCYGKGQEKIEVDDMYGYTGYYMQTCESCEGTGIETVYDKTCKSCGKEFEGFQHSDECEPCWQHAMLVLLDLEKENEAE